MGRIISLVLIFLILAYAGTLLRDAGVFKTIHPEFFGDEHGVDKCRVIGGVPGPEDLVRIGEDGVLIASAPFPRLGSAPEGSLYYLNGSGAPQKLQSAYPKSFHPHGFDVIAVGDGTYQVAVVNHAVNGTEEEDEIDFFRFDPRTSELRFEKKAADPLLGNSTNDLVLTSLDHFYATEDHAATTHLGKSAEDFLRLGRGFIAYYDGAHFSAVYRGIAFANGIIRLPGSDIVVASMLSRKIMRFRESAPGALELKSETKLDAGPDNLFFEPETQSLWIGAHPKLFKLKAASKNATALSPSRLWRIREFNTDHASPVEEIFEDSGEHLSALSTAITQNGRLWMSAVYGERLLDCPLPPESKRQ